MSDHASLLCHVNLANGFRGGERQTMLLLKALADKGIKQKLISRRDSELSKRCEFISGLDVIETSLFGIDAFFKIPKNTLFHFHDSRSFPLFYFYNKLKAQDYVYTRRVQRAPKLNFISRNIYRGAKSIICLSTSIEKSLRNSFGEGINSKLIPSASAKLEYNSIESLKIRKKIKQEFLVGHIGELDDSHKGQKDIIELAQKVKDRGLDIGFVLVGSGRDELILKELSKDLENIYFTGQVENVGDYLNAFDLFIFPSRHEGLGSILLDALEFGLPLITSDAGGIPDIIEDGKNGYIVRGRQRNYLDPLIKLYENSDLRQSIGNANILKSSKYTIDLMVESYIIQYGNQSF